MTLTLGALAVGFASILGGATGFGASLLSTPLLVLAGYPVADVVVVNLSATLTTRAAVLCRSYRAVDRRCVALLVAGSAPGAVLGAITAGAIPPEYLRPAAGVLVAVAGGWLALGTRGTDRDPSNALRAATGVVGGYLSTTTSLNGPPVAVMLARSRVEPASFIANLACYFVVTDLLSLAVLGLRSQIPPGTLWPVLPPLVLAALGGNLFGGWLGGRLPARTFRWIVIALIVAAGVTTAVT